MGLGRYDEARAALEDYVRLVQESGTRSFAIPRLHLLAHVTENAEMLARIEAILSELGTDQLGYGQPLAREYLAAEPGTHVDRAERWETLLPIALRDD